MHFAVLSSGGLDSTTCLALCVQKYGTKNVSAINVFYGQRNRREMSSSRLVASHYGVSRTEVDLSICFDRCRSSLVESSGIPVEHGSYEMQASQGRVKSLVPFRNGLFISAVATRMLGEFPDEDVTIVLGNHGTDVLHNEYPDCSHQFIVSMNNALSAGTDGHASLLSPLDGMTKAEVVGLGLKLGVPFELTWSCYNGEEQPCGVCASCLERASAFRCNGVEPR